MSNFSKNILAGAVVTLFVAAGSSASAATVTLNQTGASPLTCNFSAASLQGNGNMVFTISDATGCLIGLGDGSGGDGGDGGNGDGTGGDGGDGGNGDGTGDDGGAGGTPTAPVGCANPEPVGMLTMNNYYFDSNNTSRTTSGVVPYVLKFTQQASLTANNSGRLSLIPSSDSSKIHTVALSACPNDFNVASACLKTGEMTSINWAFGQASTRSVCGLERNRPYYVNVKYTNGATSTVSTCDKATCTFYIEGR